MCDTIAFASNSAQSQNRLKAGLSPIGADSDERLSRQSAR